MKYCNYTLLVSSLILSSVLFASGPKWDEHCEEAYDRMYNNVNEIFKNSSNLESYSTCNVSKYRNLLVVLLQIT